MHGLARTSLPAIVLALAWAGAARAAAPLLPDLQEDTPGQIAVQTTFDGATPVYRLGFSAGAANLGLGPLLVDASRPDTSTPYMTATQRVMSDDGSSTDVPDAGTLRYVVGGGHEHWHYMGFELYELRSANDYARVARDQKTGFCFGDSFKVNDPPPGTPPDPVFDGSCDLGQPDALSVSEGISVGWIDSYAPQKEGQYIDLTGIPAGRYLLVQRVNPDRSLRESRYDNDASSALLELSPPDVQLLRLCPGRQSCPAADVPPGVSAAPAAFTGSVDPNGSETTWHLEYGTTTAYGRATGDLPLDPGEGPQQVSATPRDLAPGTTYHYRLVARNAFGTAASLDRTFTTPAPPPLRVLTVRALRRGNLRIALAVPGAGSVRASAGRFSRPRATLGEPGVATLVLRPSRTLRIRPHMRVSVRVVYAPASGATQTLAVVARLRR